MSPAEDQTAVENQTPDEAASAAEAGEKRVRTYDFRRPQYLSADQVRNLQRLHTAAADSLQERLSRAYGSNIQIRLEKVEEMAFGLLQEHVAAHTYTNILDLAPLNAQGVFYVESQICLAFVDRVLGGFSATPPEARQLTSVDEVAVEGVIDLMLSALRDQWNDFCEMGLAVQSRRTDPELAQLWSQSEPVLSVTLAMTGGLGEGRMRLCMPVARLKAAMDGVSNRMTGRQSSPEQAERLKRALMHSLEATRLPVSARFDQVEVPLRNLLALKVGDILRLDHPADDPILLHVGEKTSFLAKMGLRGRRKAAQVIQRIEDDEE